MAGRSQVRSLSEFRRPLRSEVTSYKFIIGSCSNCPEQTSKGRANWNRLHSPIASSRLCAFIQRGVNVHANMNQIGNGQFPDHIKLKGNYTGERLPIDKEQHIINLLSLGEPIAAIARLVHCSRDSVRGVRERKSDDIRQRKQMIAASAARLAADGFNKLNEEMQAGKIKGALLVPVTGMAVDKLQALSGDPALVIRHEHDHQHSHRHFADFNKLLEQLPDDEPKPIEVDVITSRESGAGMGLKSQTEISKNS